VTTLQLLSAGRLYRGEGCEWRGSEYSRYGVQSAVERGSEFNGGGIESLKVVMFKVQWWR
jgi:hypothetical protein